MELLILIIPMMFLLIPLAGGIGMIVYAYHLWERDREKRDAYQKWYDSLPPEQQYMVDQERARKIGIAYFLGRHFLD